MSATVLPFPRVPIRALVVVPADEPHRDLCRVIHGGYAFDGPPLVRGRLEVVLRELRAEGRGLPVTVHPECERRQANEHGTRL